MGFYADADFLPDRAIGYLIRRVHQLGGAALEPVFAAEGLTGAQWSTLVSIWFQRGRTAADLARDLGHDTGAMTRLVDIMERNGWVTRARASEDRRCIILALTPAGEDIALRCKAKVIACWNEWLVDWSYDEIETLIALLQKLRGTLSAAGRRA